MPQYVYRCTNVHQREIWQSITSTNSQINCPQCNELMHRVPQLVRVNWGGLPPHLEHLRGKGVREMLDRNKIAERRDDYEKNLEIVRNKKGAQDELQNSS